MGTGVDPKWHAYNVSAYCYHKKLAHRHLEHINDLFVFGAGAIRSSIHCWVHRGPSAFSHWHLGLRSVRDDNAGTGYFLFYKFYWTIEHQTNEILNCHHLSGEAHSTQEWSIVAGGILRQFSERECRLIVGCGVWLKRCTNVEVIYRELHLAILVRK